MGVWGFRDDSLKCESEVRGHFEFEWDTYTTLAREGTAAYGMSLRRKTLSLQPSLPACIITVLPA